MSLLGFLPLLAFVVLYLVLLQTDRDESGAFISASLVFGVFAVLTTEALSLFDGVSITALTVVWSLPIGVGAGWLVRRRRLTGGLRLPRVAIPASRFLRFVAAWIAVVLLLTAVIAWFAPPNTWDALTYHMSRLAHWAQRGTIGHYASGIDAQNFMPPGASILGLQVYVLGQSDRLVNFVQWMAMVGCLIVAARIASRFGAGERGQWFAAAFVVTLPTGILQATSVTTDYVVALWVAIAVSEVVDLWQGRGGPTAVLELGAAAGLAMATKQTALAYLAPFAAVMAVIVMRRSRLLWWAVPGLLVLSVLNVGHLTRNVATYGNPGGLPRRVDTQTNQVLDGRVLVSNVLRSASLHLGTPSPHINKAMGLALIWVHEQIGLDINDRRTTAEGTFRIKPPTLHETRGGNLAHAILLFALVPLAWHGRRLIPSELWAYIGLVVVAFVLLNAIFQWKPTGARYHLAFFVLMAPVAGVVLEAQTWKAAANVAIGILMLSSVPWLLGNHSRPLLSGWPGADVGSVLAVPRDELYFANAPYLVRPYQQIVGAIREAGCQQVAVALPGQGLEYPLWLAARLAAGGP
jgi:hypothetical protein